MGKTKKSEYFEKEKALSKNQGRDIKYRIRKQEEVEGEEAIVDFLQYVTEQPEERDDPV